MKIEGYKTYRHKDNPQEKVFHDIFVKEYATKLNGEIDYHGLSQISQPTNERSEPITYLNKDEVRTMISIIQWLGSPVGQGFLQRCGWEIKKEVDKDTLKKHNLSIKYTDYGIYQLLQNGEYLTEGEKEFCHQEAKRIINKHL